MKRHLIQTFLACGAALMAAPLLQAQTAAPAASPACTEGVHQHHGGGVLEHLTSALSLTSTQQAQVSTILQQAGPQFKALHDEMQARRKALVDSVASQITPVLTPDQQAKFAELVQKFENQPEQGGRFAHRGQFGPHHVLQFLTTKLNLTTDQQSQVKPILVSTHTQIRSIRQNASLTREEKIAQIKQAMDAAQNQINGVLTPAQQQQLSALRAQFEQNHHHGPAGESSSSIPAPANS
jgi:protein CpxP